MYGFSGPGPDTALQMTWGLDLSSLFLFFPEAWVDGSRSNLPAQHLACELNLNKLWPAFWTLMQPDLPWSSFCYPGTSQGACLASTSYSPSFYKHLRLRKSGIQPCKLHLSGRHVLSHTYMAPMSQCVSSLLVGAV